MRINLLLTAFMILLSLTFIFVSDRAESVDITNIINGMVVEIKPDFIKISYQADQGEVRISIDPNTVYDNTQKWTDFKAGDKVQVEYHMVQNKNTAITITKLSTGGGDINI